MRKIQVKHLSNVLLLANIRTDMKGGMVSGETNNR